VMDADAALTRYPQLRPLVAMRDPRWRFDTLDSGVVTGARAHETYTETLWIIDELRAGVSRRPARERTSAVPTLNFSGPLSEAVALLEQPPGAQRSST
jgi:hypothetical protein